MTDNKNTKRRFFGKPSKKALKWVGLAALLGTVAYYAMGSGLIEAGGGKSVDFTQLTKEEIPQTIEKDVIPEYRDLERALGCLIDGKVYVVVTRGEKPTAGFDLSIEKMKLEKNNGGTNLVVTALFTEPPADTAVSQIITYPYAVASTELTALPDTIELSVKYAE